ncbi:MAG: radical SAM protein [Deltaproteobacteria bacterium]|jgi:radical SAM protein with 4Fe4S-binding SPASM domain|nr:radical SAM protein [Deltaproteobacteria bacterium]
MAKTLTFSDFHLFKNAKQQRRLLDLTLELTARCNNNCNHCYNNLPQNDLKAKKKELTTSKIKEIIDQAFDLGVLRVLFTGGEALLRDDFFDLYKYTKKKGCLVSVFTNATLISEDHIKLFKKYPPRRLEVTVYGTSKEQYAKVTKTDNFSKFKSGLDRLFSASIPVTLKAMVFQSTLAFLQDITQFSTKISHTNFRYDPFLTLRTDKDPKKNLKIIKERLSVTDIIELEKHDSARLEAVKKRGFNISKEQKQSTSPERLFKCGAGQFGCFISYDGFLRLCGSLVNKKCVYDLKKGSLKYAWEEFIPEVLMMTSKKQSYIENCGICKIRDICMWCPASAELETTKLNEHVQYFCDLAKQRYEFCIQN